MKMLTLEERSRQIQAKLDAGTEVPAREALMNNGRHRTQSKRELLAAVKRVRRDRGETVGFEAKF